MSYYSKDHQAGDDDVHDFDDYDPTPYGGGYDIAVTYGRPLPPSEEICHPKASEEDEDFDYNRPQYKSEAQPSAYAFEALENEYKGYSRPPPNRRPHDVPQPNYGFQPGGGGVGFDGSDLGSGYGRKPSYGEVEGDGSGYGRKPNYGEGGGGRYGSGRKPSYGEEEEGGGYGSGYGRKPNYGEEGGGERYGRKPSYGEEGGGERHGSGYGRRPERTENEESHYGEERAARYGRRPDQDGPEVGDQYGRPSYGRPEVGDQYGRPAYGKSKEREYGRSSYEKHEDSDDEKSHGRKKYASSFFPFSQSSSSNPI